MARGANATPHMKLRSASINFITAIIKLIMTVTSLILLPSQAFLFLAKLFGHRYNIKSIIFMISINVWLFFMIVND